MPYRLLRIAPLAISAALLMAVAPAVAQSPAPSAPVAEAEGNYLEGLKSCQAIADDTERLACYDRSVGRVVSASEEGEVRLVDSEDVRKTRRRLFGFSMPDIGLFGNDDDEDDKPLELLQSTITSVRYNRREVVFTIAEGDAVWRIASAPPRLGRIKVGDSVEFKRASLGSYFIRVNGQMGVKGRRVE